MKSESEKLKWVKATKDNLPKGKIIFNVIGFGYYRGDANEIKKFLNQNYEVLI